MVGFSEKAGLVGWSGVVMEDSGVGFVEGWGGGLGVGDGVGAGNMGAGWRWWGLDGAGWRHRDRGDGGCGWQERILEDQGGFGAALPEAGEEHEEEA